MTGCRCPEPLQTPDPRHRASCARCGRLIGARSGETLAAFWERFEDAQPGAHLPLWKIPGHLAALKHQSMAREQTGRGQFGDAYLARDNLAEAAEELSDAFNYVAFTTEQDEREDREPEWDLVLEFANCMGRAYELLGELRHKRAGAP